MLSAAYHFVWLAVPDTLPVQGPCHQQKAMLAEGWSAQSGPIPLTLQVDLEGSEGAIAAQVYGRGERAVPIEECHEDAKALLPEEIPVAASDLAYMVAAVVAPVAVYDLAHTVAGPVAVCDWACRVAAERASAARSASVLDWAYIAAGPAYIADSVQALD